MLNDFNIDEKLNKYASKGRDYYNNIINDKDSYHYFSINLDSSELIDKEQEKDGIRGKKHDLPESLKQSFFTQLDLQKNINSKACLYFFECHNSSKYMIIEKYNEAKGNNIRSYSALAEKKSSDLADTHNILYVGKVKTGIGARLATHFGYANAQTGGLQLKHWAKDLDLKLTVHIIAFKENIDDFINPIELELTKSLRPIIGKSK